MSELNEALESLAKEINGTRALLVMDASGMPVAGWGDADFETAAAELAEVWKQMRGAETVSASGSVRALEVVASERRWALIPLGDDYLLTIATGAGGGPALPMEEIRRRIRAKLRNVSEAELFFGDASADDEQPVEPTASPEPVTPTPAATPDRPRSALPWVAALAVAAVAVALWLWRPAAETRRNVEGSPASAAAVPGASSSQSELKRLVAVLNETEGVAISAAWAEERVVVKGTVTADADRARIEKAFQQIPGLASVSFEVRRLRDLPIGERIYFPYASAEMKAADAAAKCEAVSAYLKQQPGAKLRVIGHTDPIGTDETNHRIALARAEAVKEALARLGADPGLLVVEAVPRPPPDVDAVKPLWMSRCVRFLPLPP